MQTAQAVLYVIAIILLVLAGFGFPTSPPPRYSLALFGAAFALTAYALPTIFND